MIDVRQIDSFVKELQGFLPQDCLHVNDEVSLELQVNTLAFPQMVLGSIAPRNLDELKKIVQAAGKFGVPLSPISCGKNIGYGESTPWAAGQFVLQLKNLRQIRHLDLESGEVWIEPGVTQAQLADHLRTIGAQFWTDITGASPDSSVLGNTLDAGFGYSQIGDHRKHILDMEVLLADGRHLQLGTMPGLGPQLTQLFVQSNFAIVTALKIPLLPIPEKIISFSISFTTESDFLKSLPSLRTARQQGIISSLMHTANATRALITCGHFPKNQDPRNIFSESDCLEILNENGLLRYGAWTAVGSVSGLKAEVAIKKCALKKAFCKTGAVRFYSDKKMRWLDWMLQLSLIRSWKRLDLLRASFASLKAVHGMMQGTPSSLPSGNIFWRTPSEKDLGLIWFSPIVDANEKAVSTLLSTTRAIFSKYRLEMPITLTSISPRSMISVFSIHFNRSAPEEVANAHKAYEELVSTTKALGFSCYRMGILSSKRSLYDAEKELLLQQLKSALDPQNIIAPGRYGIDYISPK